MTDITYNNTHAVVQIGSVLGSTGGAHIESFIVKANTDNGKLIGKGDFIDLDLYDEGTATKFSGIIRKYENEHYLIEVQGDTDAYLLYQSPIIDGSNLNAVKKDPRYFTNKAGTAVRGYQLKDGDSWWVTKEGFDGTVDNSSIGKTVSIGTAGKLKVAAGA